MDSNVFIFFIIILAIWLSVVTFFLYKSVSHYNKLVKGVTNRDFKSVIEDILKDVNTSKKDIDYLKSYCDRIEKDGQLHIQKIGLVRFNPFRDTGGDQSFVLSLVNSDDTGVIISGLYARNGTRWYAKKVVKGRGIEHDLSDEEKNSLKEANKRTNSK
jgi:hypothetical protein